MRIYPAAHTHAPLRIYAYAHACTHVYAHAKEIFWQQICFTALSNRVSSSVRQHSLLLSNSCTIHIHIGATIATLTVQTVIICHSFSTNLQQSSDYIPTIYQLFNHLYSHLPFIITSDHYLEQFIYTLYSSLSNFQSDQLIIISICQYVIKPYQFSIYIIRFIIYTISS